MHYSCEHVRTSIVLKSNIQGLLANLAQSGGRLRVVTVLLELNDKLSVGIGSWLFSLLPWLDRVEDVNAVVTYGELAS